MSCNHYLIVFFPLPHRRRKISVPDFERQAFWCLDEREYFGGKCPISRCLLVPMCKLFLNYYFWDQ